MLKVGITQAKNELTKLIRLAEKGEVITILRHGHPVVEVRRLEPQRRRRGDDPIADLLDDVETIS